ncbi:MAG TPA: oligosaccharide flippase family protein [Candidatus Kapabacteria bacterium]
MILVARSIAPAEFGVLSVFQTLFTILFTFSDGFALQAIVKFGVEPGVQLEELVTVTTLLFILFLGTALTILLLFPAFFSRLLNIPELAALIPYLALFAVFTMPRVVLSKVLQSKFRMKEIFFVDFANFGIATIVLIILLWAGRIHSAASVIHITMLSGLLSSIVAILLTRPHVHYRFSYSKTMLSRISEFVRYQAAMGVVSTANQNLDILIVSSFTGAVGVGIYNGAKILFRGFDVVRETMTLFVFPATSKYHSRNELSTLRTILEKSVSFLILGLIPVAALLFVGAPSIFHLLYGIKFDTSIPIFRILLIAILFYPIQMVFGVTMTGMGKIKEAFRMFTITLIVNVTLSITLLAITHNIIAAAIAFVAASATQTIQLYTYINRNIGIKFQSILSRGFRDAFSFAQASKKKYPF